MSTLKNTLAYYTQSINSEGITIWYRLAVVRGQFYRKFTTIKYASRQISCGVRYTNAVCWLTWQLIIVHALGISINSLVKLDISASANDIMLLLCS